MTVKGKNLSKIIFSFSYLGLILYSFLFGGSIQMFLGVSVTGLNIIIILLLLTHFIFFVPKRNMPFKRVMLTGTILLTYIIGLTIVQEVSLLRTTLYSIMVLLPILLILNEYARDILGFDLRQLKKLLLVIALLQLPVLLVQLNSYEVLKELNNSGQGLLEIDFDFGTLLFKNDHALGFFLICNVLFIVFNDRITIHSKLLLVFILSVSVFLLNSKTSIGLLLISYVYIFANLKKIKNVNRLVVGALVAIIILGAGLSVLFKPDYYDGVREAVEKRFDYKSAIKYYELTQARRDQIINIWVHEDINWIGNGAYSYFNIEKGEFSETNIHFSQWLWAYYDLGVIGTLLELIFFVSIVRTFRKSRESFNWLIGIYFLLYGFFTIVAFDLNFLLIYFIYKRKNEG